MSIVQALASCEEWSAAEQRQLYLAASGMGPQLIAAAERPIWPMPGAVFAGAALERAQFDGIDLTGASFALGILVECRFRRCRLCRADFRGATIDFAVFDGADVQKASFAGATAADAQFRRAHGPLAQFACAQLSYASFAHAELEYADFRGADLRGADFRASDLHGADFRGADVTGALFDLANVSDACFVGATHEARMRGKIARAATARPAAEERDALLAEIEQRYVPGPARTLLDEFGQPELPQGDEALPSEGALERYVERLSAIECHAAGEPVCVSYGELAGDDAGQRETTRYRLMALLAAGRVRRVDIPAPPSASPYGYIPMLPVRRR